MTTDVTPEAVKQTVAFCVNQLIDFGTQNLQWTYSKCETGSFSFVYIVNFYISDDGGNRNQKEPRSLRQKSVICKSRLSSEGGFSNSTRCQDISQQDSSLEVQMFLHKCGIAPKMLFCDLKSGLEIQEYFGSTRKAADLDVAKVACLLARVHLALDEFSKTTQRVKLPSTWTGIFLFT